MLYIFPRQFGLHNVFTSSVDKRETVQPFKDYTLREDEIDEKYNPESSIKIPKRLRGKAMNLVQKLLVLHSRCSYSKLIEHYCSVCYPTPTFTIIVDFLRLQNAELMRKVNRKPMQALRQFLKHKQAIQVTVTPQLRPVYPQSLRESRV